MPVQSTNSKYDAMLPLWEKSRIAKEGQEAVHAAGEAFLPRLDGQDDEEYLAYLLRALYFNATQRTIDGMSGLIFRKAPEIDVDGIVQDYLGDIDLAGETAEGLVQGLVDEILTVGRAGVLVDHPPRPEGTVLSLADAQRLEQRPFMRLYVTEAIIDWHFERVGNMMKLTQVRLREKLSYDTADEFVQGTKEQIRVLELVDGFYQQRVFVQGDDGGEFVEDPKAANTPRINNTPLSFIPFIFFGTKNTDPIPDKPPLLDLVNVNLSHYRTSADLEHGAHFTGLPTGIITGHRQDDDDPIPIGASEMICLPDADANAFMLEFQGQGLGALEKLMAEKEAKMAAIGARMLAPEKTGVEASETLAIRAGGENSVLASIARAVDLGFTWALNIMSAWAGRPETASFALNKDYLPVPMSAADLTSLVGAWQSGALSPQELFLTLQRGEVISDQKTFEQHSREVEAQQMNAPGLQGEEQDLDETEEAEAA